jgi:pimeloyl-ACP methyl ester carboxylesterase
MTAFTARTVESDGVRLATRDYGGSGQALVLLHGGGMEQGSLEPLVEQLRAAFRVVTFDLRGHGGTGPVPFTFASSVQDVAAVADAYGLGVPAVGGHSLGGMVATAYGVAHPSCPAVINIDGHGRGQVDQYVGLDEHVVREHWEAQARRLDRLTRGVRALALRGVLHLLGKKPTSTGATIRQVTREVEGLDLFAWYRRLACPLLVFNATALETRPLMRLWAGKGVPMVAAFRQGLVRDLAALAEEKDHVRVVTVDATHMLVRTHPELVAREVASFLSVAPAV